MNQSTDVSLDRACADAVTLAVLAGGEGSRMGIPKGMLAVRGEPILAYLLRQIGWPGPTMLVTAPGREHPPACERFSVEVVDPEAQGPLRGVLTALENLATPFVAVITVDMPNVRIDQLGWLMEELSVRPRTLGIMCRRLEDGGDRVEPFPSIYRREAKLPIGERLLAGRRSVHGLLEHSCFEAVSTPVTWKAQSWLNLNRPDDLARFMR